MCKWFWFIEICLVASGSVNVGTALAGTHPQISICVFIHDKDECCEEEEETDKPVEWIEACLYSEAVICVRVCGGTLRFTELSSTVSCDPLLINDLPPYDHHLLLPPPLHMT